jgi:DNA-binding transcriptional LysR family regulator
MRIRAASKRRPGVRFAAPERDHAGLPKSVKSPQSWGAGIGQFPISARAFGAKIGPLRVDLQRAFDIWLSYHPDSNRIPRIRRMIDWIILAFNLTRIRWFKDEFSDPNDLKAVYKGESLINLFEGFSTEGRQHPK